MSINKIQLGKSIRQIRELRGFSQAALAEKSGLQGNTVALIERGQRGVSLEALNALAEVLEVPAACLTMLGTSEMTGDSKSIGLVKSMQELILGTIVAQAKLRAQEVAALESQAKVDAAVTSPALKAVARKVSSLKVTKARLLAEWKKAAKTKAMAKAKTKAASKKPPRSKKRLEHA